MTAATASAPRRPATLAEPSRYQACFWRSPFAVATAAVVAAQAALMSVAATAGQAFPYETGLSLTSLSAIMLTAGLWPNWNYLAVTEDGLDQQAGLRSLRVAWREVEAVRCGEGWVRVKVRGRERTVFNRYDLDAEAFARLIERTWLRNRD